MSTAAERARWEVLPDGGLLYNSRINAHARLRREAAALGHRLGRFELMPHAFDPQNRLQLLSLVSCQRCGAGALSNLTNKTLYPGELLTAPCV